MRSSWPAACQMSFGDDGPHPDMRQRGLFFLSWLRLFLGVSFINACGLVSFFTIGSRCASSAAPTTQSSSGQGDAGRSVGCAPAFPGATTSAAPPTKSRRTQGDAGRSDGWAPAHPGTTSTAAAPTASSDARGHARRSVGRARWSPGGAATATPATKSATARGGAARWASWAPAFPDTYSAGAERWVERGCGAELRGAGAGGAAPACWWRRPCRAAQGRQAMPDDWAGGLLLGWRRAVGSGTRASHPKDSNCSRQSPRVPSR